jgi:NitT/TauT family transport system substrate-binding protein
MTNRNIPHKKLFINWAVFTYIVAVTLVLSACSANTPSAKNPTLKVAWVLWPSEYPLVIAQDKGFFEKHGVSVELAYYDVISNELADIQSGKVDGGFNVPGDLLQMWSKSPDTFKGVLVVDSSNGADVIVATQDIQTPADLRGKRVGVLPGTFGELFVDRMLKANGLRTSDVTLINIDPSNVPDSLSVQIDAGHSWEPYTSKALTAGNHIIFSSSETPGLISDVLVFKTAIINERSEDIRAFIAAYYEALDFWKTNPQEAVAIIAKHTGLKPEEISTEGIKILTLKDNEVAFSNANDTTSIYFTTQLFRDFMINAGILSKSPDVQKLFHPLYK